MPRKLIDPKKCESWTRGRAAYREKCEKELLKILSKHYPQTFSIRVVGLPWAGSATMPDDAVAKIIVMQSENSASFMLYLDNVGNLVKLLAARQEEKERMAEVISSEGDRIWEILTRIF